MFCWRTLGLAVLAGSITAQTCTCGLHTHCGKSQCYDCFESFCAKKRKEGEDECERCCWGWQLPFGTDCAQKDLIRGWCQAKPGPHAHHPAPHAHHPAPGPGPHPGPGHVHNPGLPVCASWPSFDRLSQLKASAWDAYLTEVYGSSPPNDFFPLDIGEWWMLWDDLLAKHHVSLPKSSGTCAPSNCQLNYFAENNAYAPVHTSWIWHPPPYAANGPWVGPFAGRNGWVEVMHQKDPFGDEHHGCWFLFARGSGVWYQTGKYIEFPEHSDAYKHFNAHDNEGMCQAAAAAGYDTIIFLAHHDSTNYPCAKQGGYPYMNVEIVATKLQGTYSCGATLPPSSAVLRSGWATDECKCNNGLTRTNCGQLFDERLARLAAEPTNGYISTIPWSEESSVESPTDCSANHTSAVDPAWFANCNAVPCLRIFVSSSSNTTFNIGNSTDGTLESLGFRWCIDHTNSVVYAMQTAAQPRQPPYHVAYFELDAHSTGVTHPVRTCRFLAAHWTSGDVVHVYQQDQLNCTRSYAPSQLPGPDGVTNVTVHIA